MKIVKLFVVFAIVMAMMSCHRTETISDTDMNTIRFSQSQADALAVIACNEARGDQSSLARAVDAGLSQGLTVNQIKEAFSQLYAYTGFPRSLNALGTLQKVLSDRAEHGVATDEGQEATPMVSHFDALARGTEVQTKLCGGTPFNYDFCPAEDYYLKAHLFGDIFARDVLNHAERELVTVGALSGLEGVMPQLLSHVRGAKNMGVELVQLHGLVDALRAAGLQREADRCAYAIMVVEGGEAEPVSPSAWPLGDSNATYAQYFVGQSYLAVLDGGLCNVSFEPGCRNNWHVHHGAVQVLICVSGRGWYQEWGKEPVELRPGTTIAVPEGVKHWHGAAADSWMQHLTYHTDVRPGNRTEWLEPVADSAYLALHSIHADLQ